MAEDAQVPQHAAGLGVRSLTASPVRGATMERRDGPTGRKPTEWDSLVARRASAKMLKSTCEQYRLAPLSRDAVDQVETRGHEAGPRR